MNKPDDVSAEAWQAVQDAIMIACNNHHAWGALATMTNEWRDDLAVLNARAIDAAIAKERERVDKAEADRDRLVEALRKIAEICPNEIEGITARKALEGL